MSEDDWSSTIYCQNRAARGAEALAYFADQTPAGDLLALTPAERARWGQMVAAESARSTCYGPDWWQHQDQVNYVVTDLVCELLHLLDGHVAPEPLLAAVHEIRAQGPSARVLVDELAQHQADYVVQLIACLADLAAMHDIDTTDLLDRARIDYEDETEERRIAETRPKTSV